MAKKYINSDIKIERSFRLFPDEFSLQAAAAMHHGINSFA